MTTRPYKRRIKLIKPNLQLKLTFTFVGLSALSLLLQFVLFTTTLSGTALSLPNDGQILMGEINEILLRVLGVSFLVFLPITFAVGVLCTFRLAGPVYRFETFITQILRGEKPPDFHLRRGDQLQRLANLLNEVTRPLRGELEGAAPEDGASAVDAVPSLVREAAEASTPAEDEARTGERAS